ncbi:uncharacterized protein KQ657_000782 [Scheffersomyces spartinae]|uniref:A to I editase domain-containing protein n=1 Tax=Scheffersomyces spartinae TaxID=45513 RepID=A0A9P8AI49_9ASCO|nr:uncharacterized protein KQ657_000782 [Scheffersomyces spartinae]KAG7193365.1 hypothetical protein KQ657_000782 [Scheffersomyces spartinae]
MNINKAIANEVYKNLTCTFNGLLVKSGKPIVRSNGVKEWTVLSGICAVEKNDDANPNVELIALATGVKCLPDKTREYSHGSIVHDSHAEILVLRLFNWFILKECQKKHSQYLLKGLKGTYYWNKKYKLALYISEPPCGDASTLYLASKTNSTDNWEDEQDKDNCAEEPKTKKPKLVRGRFGFGQLGIIRSKPGRLDSIPTKSKSCSDKLTVKQVTGVTNALVSLLLPDGVYIDYLVLGEFKEEDTNRCFNSRISNIEQKQALNVVKFDKKEDEEYEYKFHRQDNFQPSPLSLLYIAPYNFVEVLNNGVKNGSYIKNKPPKPSGESIICNKQLYQLFTQVYQGTKTYTSYNELKVSNEERQHLKDKARSTLGIWTSTSLDDFSLL